MTKPNWELYQTLQEMTANGQVTTSEGYTIPIDLEVAHRKGLQLALNPPASVSWRLVLKSVVIDSLRKYKREVLFDPEFVQSEVDLEDQVVLRTEVDRLIEAWNTRRKGQNRYPRVGLVEAVQYQSDGDDRKYNAIKNRLHRFRTRLQREDDDE